MTQSLGLFMQHILNKDNEARTHIPVEDKRLNFSRSAYFQAGQGLSSPDCDFILYPY